MGSSASKRKNLYSDFLFLTKHIKYDINLNKFLYRYTYKKLLSIDDNRQIQCKSQKILIANPYKLAKYIKINKYQLMALNI